MSSKVSVAILAYATCAVLAFGLTNANFRTEFPSLMDKHGAREQCGMSAMIAALGPIGLFVSFFAGGLAQDGLSYDCGPISGAPGFH